MGNCINSKGLSVDVKNGGPGLRSTQKQGAKELKQNYIIDNNTKILGSGAFGKVFLTHNKHDSNHQVAIKVMNKSKLKDHLEAIQEEVQILTKLDHPNIVKYYETYIDEKYIYLVMEYIGGGELFDKIASQKNQVFSEEMARDYMRKLFGALHHMHSQGIVHRDIKPENIMLAANGELKLIDFGLSKRQTGNAKLKTIAGTPYYMAPEVLESKYDSKCDIQSLGVLLYVFMSGYLPFQGENRNDVFYKITNGKYHFNHPEFKDVSDEAIDLIKKCLTTDPKQRVNAGEALNHPWFKNAVQFQKAINKDILNRLSNFKGVSKLKKAAMNMLVKMSDANSIEELRAEFVNIDKDKTGLINAEELKQAIKQSDINIPDEQIEKIINEVDYFGNGKINYTEFLVATLDVKHFLDDNKLQAIFNQFDTDGSGVITRENIITAMNKIGHSINQQELDQIMKEHDLKKDGVISFMEFKLVFMDIADTQEPGEKPSKH